MKVKIKIEKEVEVTTLQVNAGVRYWVDSEINGEPDTENGENVPCKNGELWTPEIEIETGKILNWKQGVKAEIHYKICDCCGWALKDEKAKLFYLLKMDMFLQLFARKKVVMAIISLWILTKME